MKAIVSINSILRTARKIRFNLWMLEGEERASKKNISILCLGGGAEKTYIADLAFNGAYRETLIGKKWIWNLHRVMVQRMADIAVVTNSGPLLYRYLSDGKEFYIPNWVQGEIVFSEVLARMKTSSHLKSDLRRIRKNEFKYELTKSPSKYDEFYNTMYLPYISKVYGRTAHLMSYDRMKELEGQSELMLITRHGEPLAGQILVYEKDRVRCWSIGVKDGNREYVKMGAQAALYWYEIQYLSECGYKAMHVGVSRPFLRDGVLQFKNKWGMNMLQPTRKGLLLKPLRKSEGAMSFLENNPFIDYESERYVGIIFSDSGASAASYRNLCAPYFSFGLNKLMLYSNRFNDENSAVSNFMDDKIAIASTDVLF